MAEKKLGFEIIPTKYVAYSYFNPTTKEWWPPILITWDDRGFWASPMSAGLNYGVSVFEGMKAFRHKTDEVFLFRPQDHAKRLNRSLFGLAMPQFPEDKFMTALQLLVKTNADYMPEYRQGSLYIRPIVYGLDRLGVSYNPDVAYAAAFWCTPAGNYYTEGLKPIAVYVMKEMARAMPGGLGYCKASGNYEISRKAQLVAKEKGCQEALFLDGKTKKHIEELGAANVFVVKNGVVYAPLLRDTVLDGITRRSIMVLAKSELRLNVREKNISVKELQEADEVFACGTAAVITPIGKIKDGNKECAIGNGQVGEITKKLYELLTGIQYGEVPDKFGWLTKVKLL